MPELFRPPFLQPALGTGATYAGAKLYFYRAGTTTAITVYQNETLTTAHAVPVVADSEGIFPPIYVNSTRYKGVLKKADGTTIQTWDPITSNADAVTPQMYGAIGDGVTDDTTAIQAAITATTVGKVTIPPGVYNCGDITVSAKGLTDGIFEIEGTGAKFVGGGKFIIDGSKRVSIRGLKAQLHDLVLRGCWWGKFYGCDFRYIIHNDASGTGFSSAFWNTWIGGFYQAFKVHASATAAINATSFINVDFSAASGQGFAASADYCFEFNGNVAVQNLNFYGGQVGGFNTACYVVGAGNTAGDIELRFNQSYFDNTLPTPIDGANRTIRLLDCHISSKTLQHTALKLAARGEWDLKSAAFQAGWKPYGLFNHIPNGDFRKKTYLLVGSGFPFGSVGTATVTWGTGGLTGNYANIDYPAAGTAPRLRSAALPFAGPYTAILIMERVSGSTYVNVSVGGQSFSTVDLSNGVTIFQAGATAELAAAGTQDIVISADGLAYNINLYYAGLHMGGPGPLYMPTLPGIGESPRVESFLADGKATYNWPSIAAGATATTTVTVTGAVLGQPARCSMSVDLQGLVMTAYVSATDTVTVVAYNPTGGAIDLASATLRAWVG